MENPIVLVLERCVNRIKSCIYVDSKTKMKKNFIERFIHLWYTSGDVIREPMTCEFTYKFYWVDSALNLFIICSVTLPPRVYRGTVQVNIQLGMFLLLKQYIFSLFFRKAVSVCHIFWKLKDASFSFQVLVPVIYFNWSLLELSGEPGEEMSIWIIPIKNFFRLKLIKRVLTHTDNLSHLRSYKLLLKP